MNLAILAQASEAGSAANEDIAGTAGPYAWIVDGASGVSPRALMPGASDAAWLVGAIDAALRGRIARGDAPALSDLVSHLESELRRRFEAERIAVPESAADGPSACLALLAFAPAGTGTRVEAAVIGDVCALVPQAGGWACWTDERLKPFEAETLDVLGRSPRPPFGMSEEVLAQIRQNRLWLNRKGGYHAVHPRLPWAEAAIRFEATIPAGRPVVLASDGFLRLSDLFGHLDQDGLAEAVASGQTASLMETLRRLERDDPDGARYRRVKTHDDATVLAVAATPT